MINRSAWAYYHKFYKGKYYRIAIVFALSVLQSVSVFPVVFYVKKLVDEIIPNADSREIVEVGFILMGLLVVSGILTYYADKVAVLINTAVTKELRVDLVRRIYSLPFHYLLKKDRGELHSLFMADIGRIESLGRMIVSTILRSTFASVVFLGILLYIDWRLFLATIVLSPVLIYSTHKMGGVIKVKIDAFRDSVTGLSKGMWFVLYMTELTRLQNAEKYEIEKQKECLNIYRNCYNSMHLEQTRYGIIQKLLTGGIGLSVLIVGGYLIAKGEMSFGELVSFYLAAKLLQTYATPLLASVPTVIAGNQSLNEVHSLTKASDDAVYLGETEIDFKGHILFKDVHFKYDRDVVLEGVDLSIKPGKITLVLGPNGAGKSTITNLILGFYRPFKGQLFADGIPYDKISVLKLRGKIGIVPQSPAFFAGTIFENIVYGLGESTLEQVIEVCKKAGAHKFIDRLPEKYETSLADAGALISGGERQLLAISRALLRKPELLILDEPTNHLSKVAVEKLIGFLASEDRACSTLIISHDWKIAESVDEIYYLEEKKLKQVFSEDLPRIAKQLSVSGAVGVD
ncbi:MAG: ATP-binding cassette subfamily B protein [Candidatus Pelagisphaera sp.]|jgi:ATP-binding cassette subfamily B protein